MNNSQHHFQGKPLQFMTQLLVKCDDDTLNPNIGKVDAWVEKGKYYWAENVQSSGQYEGDVVFDLFDNNKNPIKPNETYQKWRGNRFSPFVLCLN